MVDERRRRCADEALRLVPPEYRTVSVTDVAGRPTGRSFHRGMHVAWVWGEDASGQVYLDFLSEHRHPGMSAARHFLNGTSEPISTPGSMRLTSNDPGEDAKLEKEFAEQNRAAYADLRERGLLPRSGGNLLAHEITERLTTGAEADDDSELDIELDADGFNLAVSPGLPEGWRRVLEPALNSAAWERLQSFLAREYARYDVYPRRRDVFNAFRLCDYDEVRVVILGQDPYPSPGEAHGLSFSVPYGVKKPRSLINIHKELHADLGITPPDHGNLEAWARNGVLLLNTTLTVRQGVANSHFDAGWESFTDAVIGALNPKSTRVVFLLWGGPARKKAPLVDTTLHRYLGAGHPACRPGAKLQFFGQGHFSKANELLVKKGVPPIDWAAITKGAAPDG